MTPYIRDIFIAGDSIVDGYGASDPSYRAANMLQLVLEPPGKVTAVFGTSGGTLAQITATLTALKPVAWPDIVVIEDASTSGVLGDGGTGANPIDTWIDTVETAVDFILANWGRPNARPFILVCNLWNPGNNVHEDTVSAALPAWAAGYNGAVGIVDIAQHSKNTAMHGLTLSATNTGGDTTWQIATPSTAYGNGKSTYIANIRGGNSDELYLVNTATGGNDNDPARLGSLITDIASDGSTITTTDAPAGTIETPVSVRVCQRTAWRTDTRWGDNYHPNNLGYQAIQEEIWGHILGWQHTGCIWTREARV